MSERNELKYLPVKALEANAWNPQTQEPETFARLVEEIKNVGFIDPIEVVPLDTGKFRIIGGEHRWRAALEVGLDEVPVVVLTDEKWRDEDLQKFATLRLNVLKGKLNPSKMAALYREMSEKYSEEALASLMGFTDQKALEKLVKDVKKGVAQSLPKEMQAQFDAAAKDAKTVEDLGNIIQTLFAQYGDTVQQSFMVFTYGKREHIYVAMDKKMRKAMDKVVEFARTTATDINQLMAPIVEAWMKEAVTRLDQTKPEESPGKSGTSTKIEGPEFDS